MSSFQILNLFFLSPRIEYIRLDLRDKYPLTCIFPQIDNSTCSFSPNTALIYSPKHLNFTPSLHGTLRIDYLHQSTTKTLHIPTTFNDSNLHN